jgi:NTP pyrophosphatase (non-canonical NTP hydrolase)
MHYGLLILRFGAAMLQKLIDNSQKTGWGDCTDRWLLGRIKQETDELRRALYRYRRQVRVMPEGEPSIGRLRAAVVKEAADVANFALMLADNCGGLE